MWPWVVQIDRTWRVYSYDTLENPAGSHIHSVAAIVPEWQDVRAGNVVRDTAPARPAISRSTRNVCQAAETLAGRSISIPRYGSVRYA